MKLHTTLINELVRIFEVHGGHREEWRLKSELSKIDVSTYTQKSGNNVLVLTDQLNAQINK